jgi:hypothetical protein
MSNEYNEGASIGLLLGFLIGVAMTVCVYKFAILPNTKHNIEECEKSLPRNRHCVLTAIEVTTE